jgi:hypothetical protein
MTKRKTKKPPLRVALESAASAYCDDVVERDRDYRADLVFVHLRFMAFILKTWLAIGGNATDDKFIDYFKAVITPVNNSLPEGARADIPKWTLAIDALRRHESAHEFFRLVSDAGGVELPDDINARLARDLGEWAQ